MAGHSKFKNIQHRKGAQDKKRAKIFTKLAREITTSAKIGLPDPVSNPRLRKAIAEAKSANLPKERIDKAISSATDNTNNENYCEIRYEGFAPNGIAIIVEALTDNKNRTASDVRAAFNKFAGNLGETGVASYLFNHYGIISYNINDVNFEDLFNVAIDLGAIDIISDDETYVIYTDPEDFLEISDALTKKFNQPLESNIAFVPKDTIILNNKDQAEKIFKLVDMLEDSDDVQNVFGNYELSDELYKIMQE
jgi:YebC/PmpR family DNA-binding regulatory protein